MISTDTATQWLCPRCKLHWKRVIMVEDKGSWTLSRILKCPECRLWDYPDEVGARRYGKPIAMKS